MSARDLGCNKKPCWKSVTEFFRNLSRQKRTIPQQGQEQQLDENVGKLLDVWAKQHQRAKSAALLKQQLERYEFEIAIRRMKQKVDEKKAQKRRRSTTDDILPYELEPISQNWKTALSRIHRLKLPAAKLSPEPAITLVPEPVKKQASIASITRKQFVERPPPITEIFKDDEFLKTMSTPISYPNECPSAENKSSKEPPFQQLQPKIETVSPRNELRQQYVTSPAISSPQLSQPYFTSHTISSPPSQETSQKSAPTEKVSEDVSTTTTEKNVVSSGSGQPVQQVTAGSSGSSTSTTTASKESTPTPTNTSAETTTDTTYTGRFAGTTTDETIEVMKPCHLSELLVEILKDAETPPDASDISLTSTDLAAMSRHDMYKYEKIILENTKQSLLTSQPTPEELEDWEVTGKEHEAEFSGFPKIQFSKEQVEIRTVCLTCLPRHWAKICRD